MSTVVKDLGAVSAYAYAVEKGYTGTEAEFAELMADYAEVGQRAEDAADSALESKTAAQTAATTAINKAGEATTAAQTATTKAGEASQSASTATSAKDTAVSASQTATSKATEATTAAGTATTAKNDAVTAKTAAETAQGKAEDAQAAAEAVAESIPSDYSQLSADVSDVKEDLNQLADYTATVETPSFVVGTLNSVYGTYDSSNVNRIATKNYISFEKMWFMVPDTYDYNIFFYKGYVETSLTNYISSTGWKNGSFELGTDISVPSETKIIKFIVRWHSTPNSPIVQTDFAGYRIIKKAQPTLRTLTPAITFLCRDGMATNDVPPNSVYAIRATANNQYDKIRFSVNKTTDGAYVCVHDTNINNLAVNPDGTPISTTIKTNECTLAELNQYDWGLKYGQQYAGLTVPVLSECVKYATMFNLTIALDIKFSTIVTDADIEYISGLLAKYGQLQTIFFAIPITTMQKFYAKSKKFSYLFAGTYSQADSQAGSLKLLHSAYNKIYLAYRPMGDKPTDEFINLASVNDFDLMYSPLEGIEAIASLGFDSGSSLLECHYIENIKDSVREYVSTLI